MENGCSLLASCSFPSLTSFRNVVNEQLNKMDLVSSPSDSIIINSESSKDDSVSSCEDAVSAKENGVEPTVKKPIITLAKNVTLKNFTSIAANSDVNSSDSVNESRDAGNEEESINIEPSAQTDTFLSDPLENSIVLSESDGEAGNDEAADTAQTSDPTNDNASNLNGGKSSKQVRVSPLENVTATTPSTVPPVQGSISTPLPAENSDIEILSGDNATSAQKKQYKVLVTKKTIDGTVQPREIPPEAKECINCSKNSMCNLVLDLSGTQAYLCSDRCMVENRFAQKAALQRAVVKPTDPHRPVIIRKCGECKVAISPSDNTLSWETMDFCNEDCLKLYQNKLGMQCSYCKQQCQEQSLGKYCVRFGFDIRQFCHSSCLEEYKKGIKVCSFCQEDIPNNQGFMAAINDRQHFKEFCSEDCMTNYDKMSNNTPVRLTASSCDVCKKYRLVAIEVLKAGKNFCICSDVCFNAFKFVNPHPMGFCDMCRKHFDTENAPEMFYTFVDESAISFCSKTCMNAYVIFKRKIVQCNWCKVKKYNFDMIKKIFSNRQVMMLCSFHCFSMWKQSPKRNTCDHCKTFGQIQYHLGMSDGTLRSFCGHECLMKFQLQFKKVPVTPSSARPVDGPPIIFSLGGAAKPQVTSAVKTVPQKKPTDTPNVLLTPTGPSDVATICAPPSRINDNSDTIPIISSVASLEALDRNKLPDVHQPVTVNTPKAPPARKPMGVLVSKANVAASSQMVIKQQLLLIPPPPVTMCNKSTLFKSSPCTKSKGITCRPLYGNSVETQTDLDCSTRLEISSDDDDMVIDEGNENEESGKSQATKKKSKVKEVPVIIPIPMPIYVPVPVPVYGMPAPTAVPIPVPVPICLPMPHTSFEKIFDQIQDLCSNLSEVAACRRRLNDEDGTSSYQAEDININSQQQDIGARKRRLRSLEEELTEASGGDEGENNNKRRKLDDSRSQTSSRGSGGSGSEGDDSSQQGGGGLPGGSGGGRQPNRSSTLPSTQAASPPKKSIQHIFGVHAWKKWVNAKNEEMAKDNSECTKRFNTELLLLSGDELCESLALFVTEFRKPSGEPYTADVLYYLVLGIQEYLRINGREDNIFTDSLYDKFTNAFDDIISKQTLLDNSELLVPRIEEEHLWESQQLGVYSPFSLLLTMLFITTKGFSITDVDSHMNLAFSQLMKQWPRGQSGSEKQMVKCSSLRYFPPNQPKGDSSKDAPSQELKKKYELLQDQENSFRCPVELYDYYMSKCPKSVRNRSDIFYLQPEKSYLANSPFWYTSEPLDRSLLTKMFNRLRLVKEISLVLNNSGSLNE